MKVVIAGGGTAGHVFPAIALAQELRAGGHEVVFLGTQDGLEARLVPEAGFDFTAIEAAPLARRPSLATLRAPVIGIRPVTAPRFTIAWRPNHPVMPAASSRPKVSGARTAMRMPA